jgi:hypothetical protein
MIGLIQGIAQSDRWERSVGVIRGSIRGIRVLGIDQRDLGERAIRVSRVTRGSDQSTEGSKKRIRGI